MMPEELLHCLGLEQNSPEHIWTPCRWTISTDCVFDASLVPGTCLHRLVDLKEFTQQVPGESGNRTSAVPGLQLSGYRCQLNRSMQHHLIS
jgi:hypothetical protein